MQKLKRIRYWTMNSWNRSTAPAYNLKVYNVIDKDLQDKVYEMMNTEEFYSILNSLVEEFNEYNDYEWQAGFNGRSGGYLVLYRGGKRQNKDGTYTVYSYPGKPIDDNEVPEDVMKDFDQLAVDIVQTTEAMAKEYNVEDETYTVEKTRKVLVSIK